MDSGHSGPIVCLLPVRNGAHDLSEYLQSVERFADAVVALDDGSDDETRAALESSSLVKVVLSNPSRHDYKGWDDAENRNRLLSAASELDPSWIMSLDADERIAPDDGEALRRFIETEALPGFAFGFQVFRMWQDLRHHEAVGYWVYRLFAHERGQEFPAQRLHFDPIPTAIPRSRWLPTTLRIQHLAGLDPGRREARREKYRQADPDQAFPYGYQDLTDDPVEIREWQPRSLDQPVLAAADRHGAGAAPALTAIVISRDDETRIVRAVASVVGQQCQWPFEVIVVVSGSDGTADIVRRKFPEVTLVELPQPALPGEARNAGLRIARGDYVSFPGSHVELPQGSLSARIQAHDLGYAMVTGTTIAGTRTPAGWASYFLDHSTVLPGRPSTELSGPPAHCSYLRQALIEVGGFPEDRRAGEDTVVNARVAALGYDAYRAKGATLIHHTPCRTSWRLLRHHFVRGRGFGRILLDQHRDSGRLLKTHTLRALFRLQVRQRFASTESNVEAWGGDELIREFRRVRSRVVAAAAAHWAGTCFELLRPARAKAFILWSSPVVTLAVPAGAPVDGDAATWAPLHLIRADLVTRRAKVLAIPMDLIVEAADGERSRLFEPTGSAALEGGIRSTFGVEAEMLTRSDGGEPARFLHSLARSRGRTGRRVALRWAALRIDGVDVHFSRLRSEQIKTTADGTLWTGEVADLARQIQQGLDTRDRHERIADVAEEQSPSAISQDLVASASAGTAATPVTDRAAGEMNTP
jgi:glycosyltransferase involved in cell wall biosynthesis